MQHPDEGMIHTWLDGELPVEEAAALEGHAAECEQCRAAIAEARGFIAASSRIVSSLDAVPAGVIPVARPVNRVWYSSPQFRAAAAVLVVAGASLLIMRTGTQKATLAVSTRADAIDAATAGSAERAMSRTAQSSVPEVASTPPVLADQSAAKVQAITPAEPAAAKGFSILNAPVQQPVAANRVAANRVGANRDAARKEDFSGKGVKGGATSGVINEAARLDTGATISGPAMKAADALSSPTDHRLAKATLKVIRVDSTATTKKTIYQSLSGSEVVLTEVEPGPVLSPMTVTGEASRQRAASSAPASPPPVANSPVANSPVASAPVAQKAMAVHTISWIDPSTRRRYSLSGPVSVEELEAIKARLLQAKR